MFTLEIISTIMGLLLITGGILFQVNPFFRQHVLCPFCATTSTPADLNLYVISHKDPSAFASETFLYTLDAQTGKVKHTTDLNELGEIYYQKVMNGIGYVLACKGYISVSCSNDILLAIRLSDGATLWSDVLEPGSGSVITTSTVLYMENGSHLIAINLKNGLSIWRYNLQPRSYNIILDNNKLLVQEIGNYDTIGLDDHIYALRADNGEILWSHVFNSYKPNSTVAVSPVADDGHVFFINRPYPEISKVSEFDENTGELLWKKTLNVGETIDSLRIKNHYLLIETMKHKLYVLQGSDKSVIWSYAFQLSIAPQQPDYEWIYTDDIVYGLSTEIDPHTFASNRVMRAWQISDGRKLFQINLDIVGETHIVLIQNQLVFNSINDGYGGKIYNDVEVRQAQTGMLLWHKHVGQLPTLQNYPWGLSVVTSRLQSDEGTSTAYYLTGLLTGSDTRYYLPDNGELNQSILYITLYQFEPKAHMLYALNIQNGLILWQISPDALNTDPNLHVVT